MSDSDEKRAFQVVMNEEEQYSIYPLERVPPLGWSPVGVSGTRRECLDHIERVWVDMRPKSVRAGPEYVDSAREPRSG